MEYNGYKNYETWNVALWLFNDYPLYSVVLGYKKYPQPFLQMRADLRETFGYKTTKDGVSLWDKGLDISAIDDAIREA
jgi:hypothetical protein